MLACALLNGCKPQSGAEHALHCNAGPLASSSEQLVCDSASLPNNAGYIYSQLNQGLFFSGDDFEQRSDLYNSLSSNDMSTNQAIWGDLTCTEPDQFAPTSIDLWQRHSGRWQLAVINNTKPQTIELFELSFDKGSVKAVNHAQRMTLHWRGCIFVEQSVTLKNITLGSAGVTAIAIDRATSKIKKWFSDEEHVQNLTSWQWRIDHGWKKNDE